MSQSFLQHDELIRRTAMLNKSVTKSPGPVSHGMLPKSIGSSTLSNKTEIVIKTVTQNVVKVVTRCFIRYRKVTGLPSALLFTSTSDSIFEQWARFSSNKIFGNDNNCEEHHA